LRFWKAASNRACDVNGEDEVGEEGGDEGSVGGECLLSRVRMLYVPVSQIRREPVEVEAVSMR
jgi:hypothetical protein